MIKRGVSRGKAQMLTIRMEAGCKHLEQLFSCLWILVAFTRLLVLPGVSSALVSWSLTHFWDGLLQCGVSHFLKYGTTFLFEESCYFYLKGHFT